MIPYIRSISELMAICESRDCQNKKSKEKHIDISGKENDRCKIYSSLKTKHTVLLPEFSKSIRNNWKKKKEYISSFVDELDYNNQIQSSYDLTLQERLYYKNHKEVA